MVTGRAPYPRIKPDNYVLRACRYTYVRSSRAIVPAVTIAAVIFVILLPLAWLLFSSFQAGDTGGYTLQNYVRAFTNHIYLQPIVNSLRLGLSVAVLTCIIGVPLAWVCTRTDLPGRRVLSVLVLCCIMIPAFVGTVGWVYFMAPGAGPLNRITEWAFGIEPFSPYSLNSLAILLTFFLFPYVFIFSSNALANLGSDLEEAAAIAGANRRRRARTVVLPMVAPAVIGAMLLAFLQGVSEYGAPSLITTPTGITVIPTQMFSFFTAYPPETHLAAAYGFPMAAIAVTLLAIRSKLQGRKGFVSIGGKGASHPDVQPLGRARWPAWIICFGFVGVILLIPLGSLFYLSVVKNRYHWSGFTFENYQWVFSTASDALLNTITFATISASVCVVLGLLIAILRSRVKGVLAQVTEIVATLPFAVPGIIMSVGIFAAFSHAPINLLGTSAILLIAYTGRFLPIAVQALGPAIGSVGSELEQASRISGAGSLRTGLKITVPLIVDSLIAGWILSFILTTQELAASVLLVSVGTDVASTKIASLYSEEAFEHIAALGLVLIAATVVIATLGLGLRKLTMKVPRMKGSI